jgi:hypothetical protein
MVIVLPQIIVKSFRAVTIYPFIFINHIDAKSDYVLLNHETIHLKQQKELFWIVFFLWYLIEYLFRLIYYRNTYLAYRNISFEREAYVNENNLDYLINRKSFAFLKYMRYK